MHILGIHDGHNATACYLKDGKIVSLVSEERFTNIKNHGAFPAQAMDWILRSNSISMHDIDCFAFSSLIYTNTYEHGYGESPRHKILYLLSEFVPSVVRKSNLIIKPYIAVFGAFRKRQIRKYAKEYCFDPSKVQLVEHHQAHGYAAVCASGCHSQQDSILVFTLDDSGDGVSSRVARFDNGDGYSIVQQSSSQNSICNLFSNITKYLGMQPGEHEHKLMGMAAYVTPEQSEGVFSVLRKYFYLNASGQIINRGYYGPKMLSVIRRELAYARFDSISAGMQKLLEEMVLSWVLHWTDRIPADRVVFGGGGFMNVKLNQVIAEALGGRNLFFSPSCGDESLAMGAGCVVASRSKELKDGCFASIYLGPAHTDEEIERALMGYGEALQWERVANPEEAMAEMIVGGKLIARVSGRAEWGARALGNRSILCRADNTSVVVRLNRAIKKRDFWMPFAPSIIFEDAARYIQCPINTTSDFMQLAFRATELGKKDIAAALHPYDSTCRPQLVRKEANAQFYELLVKVRDMCGLSGILNTSFNLHSYPIAESIPACINTLQNSHLDALFIGHFKISRRDLDSVDRHSHNTCTPETHEEIRAKIPHVGALKSL